MPFSGNYTTAGAGHFHLTLMEGSLCVFSIRPELISHATWWILREFIIYPSNEYFSSILLVISPPSTYLLNWIHSLLIQDDDELSVICRPQNLHGLSSLDLAGLQISDELWRALIIHVVGSASQFPAAVYHLANSLSSNGISILHISTFEHEIFLVREKDVESAYTVLHLAPAPNMASIHDEDTKPLIIPDTNLIPPHITIDESPSNGFKLCILPGYVMLARLSDDSFFDQCREVLVRFKIIFLFSFLI